MVIVTVEMSSVLCLRNAVEAQTSSFQMLSQMFVKSKIQNKKKNI